VADFVKEPRLPASFLVNKSGETDKGYVVWQAAAVDGLPMVELKQTNLHWRRSRYGKPWGRAAKPAASANTYLVYPTPFSAVSPPAAINIAGTVAAPHLLQSLHPLQFLQRFFIALPCNRGSGRR
jgi:hypothetical protein